ncbi:MAG: hypothetical protein R3Y50_06845 [Rikenellaceae bacterium]
MKQITLILITYFIVSTLNAQTLFTDRWAHKFYDEKNELYAYFAIELTQKDSIIIGNHYGVFFGGNRLEDGDGESIKGVAKNLTATISIQSGRSARIPGTAKLEFLSRESILFTIIEEPKGGEHLIPREIVLYRDDMVY